MKILPEIKGADRECMYQGPNFPLSFSLFSNQIKLIIFARNLRCENKTSRPRVIDLRVFLFFQLIIEQLTSDSMKQKFTETLMSAKFGLFLENI